MQTLTLSLSYILLLLSTSSAKLSTHDTQLEARAGSQGSSLIGSEVSDYAQGFVKSNLTPGLTLAVVRLDDTSFTADYGSWGNRTEDGDLAQPDVSDITVLLVFMCILTLVTDPVRYRVYLKGVPCNCARHPDGRFCKWPERHCAPTRAV